MISVVILTFNEESVLPGCLNSVTWCDDVLVFDSFSSDGTVEVARSAGVRLLQHSFVNYAEQRNAALREGSFKNPWVLMVDADERVTRELEVEMRRVVSTAPECMAMYRLRRKDMLFGKWIKRSGGYPTRYT